MAITKLNFPSEKVLGIQLLGAFVMLTRQQLDLTPSSKKARCLLAYLALSPQGSASRRTIASLLWSQCDEEQARVSLRQCIRHIRQTLSKGFGEELVGNILITDRESLQLNELLVWVDCHCLDQPTPSTQEYPAQQFVAIRQGQALADLDIDDIEFDNWLRIERTSLWKKACEKLEQLQHAAARAGNVEQAIALAKELINFDPLHEAATYQLMSFYAEQGERRVALDHYLNLSDGLQKQLGTLPGDKIQQLHLALLEKGPGSPASGSTPTHAPGDQDPRQILLSRVNKFWIEGLLKQSLQQSVELDVAIDHLPEAVVRPWSDVITSAKDNVPHRDDIAQIYEQAEHSLLILGAPGAGKTTLLLQLAAVLVEQARESETVGIPVVFHLTSWDDDLTIEQWLIEELSTRYGIPPDLGTSICQQQLIPLLDGLDEMPPDKQKICTAALNHFLSSQVYVPAVVCSRRTDYDSIGIKLKLNSAIVLQPLSQTQLQNCLQQLGSLHGIDDMLTQDPALKEIIDTPLMLNIAARAYPQLKQHMRRSPELLKTELFAAYAREMLKHRGEKRGYSRADSLHYLSWLAKKLIDKKQSVFFIERMQPDWLPTAWQRWCVTTGSMVVCGVMVGLILGFYGSLFHDLYISLAIALSYGIVGSIMCGWMGVAAQIRPVTRVKLSLRIFQKRTYRKLLEALLIGVFTGTGVAYLVHWQAGIIAIFLWPSSLLFSCYWTSKYLRPTTSAIYVPIMERI